jgi:hypothetical protein
MKIIIGLGYVMAQCLAIGFILGIVVQAPDVMKFSFGAFPIIIGLYYAWAAVTSSGRTWGQDIDGR